MALTVARIRRWLPLPECLAIRTCNRRISLSFVIQKALFLYYAFLSMKLNRLLFLCIFLYVNETSSSRPIKLFPGFKFCWSVKWTGCLQSLNFGSWFHSPKCEHVCPIVSLPGKMLDCITVRVEFKYSSHELIRIVLTHSGPATEMVKYVHQIFMICIQTYFSRYHEEI